MKRIASFLLVISLLISCFTITAFASNSSDSYYFEQLNGTLIRTTDVAGRIITEWRDNNGEVATVIQYPDGRIYLDGDLVFTLSNDLENSIFSRSQGNVSNVTLFPLFQMI